MPSKVFSDIGERIEEVRKKLKYKSIRSFAKAGDVDDSLLGKIMTGEKPLSDGVKINLEKNLHVNPEWIEHGTGPDIWMKSDVTGIVDFFNAKKPDEPPGLTKLEESQQQTIEAQRETIAVLMADKKRVESDNKKLDDVIAANSYLKENVQILRSHVATMFQQLVKHRAKMENRSEFEIQNEINISLPVNLPKVSEERK